MKQGWTTGVVILVGLLSLPSQTRAQHSWEAALSRMPLEAPAAELNETNCVHVMLSALRRDPKVKALIFMPGATDEFYMFHRAKAVLTNAFPSLLDAVVALTNQSLIRATFKPPMLLLHTAEDLMDCEVRVEDGLTALKLRLIRRVPRILCTDRDWDALQPALKWPLKVDLRPWRYSSASWHFYRHNFAAWNLSGWETLEAAALAGKTGFTVRSKQVIFEPDTRIRSAPEPPQWPGHLQANR